MKLFAEPDELEQWRKRYLQGGMGYGEVKKRLAELANQMLQPYRERYEQLENDNDYVEDVLSQGGKKAPSHRHRTHGQNPHRNRNRHQR